MSETSQEPATEAPSLPIRRRSFFWGAATGFGVALAGFVGWRVGRGYAPTGRQYKYLTQREAAMILALAETISPADEGFPGPEELDTAGYIDRHMDLLSPFGRLQLRALYWLFEHGTAVFGFRLRRFNDLNEEERLTYLNSWAQSLNPLRQSLLFALRGSIGFSYYSHPRIEAAMGITHKCISWHTLHDPATRTGGHS